MWFLPAFGGRRLAALAAVLAAVASGAMERPKSETSVAAARSYDCPDVSLLAAVPLGASREDWWVKRSESWELYRVFVGPRRMLTDGTVAALVHVGRQSNRDLSRRRDGVVASRRRCAEFVARYDADGAFLRATPIRGRQRRPIAITPDGGIVVGGSVGSLDRYGRGSLDIALTRYAADGRLLWVRSIAGPGMDSMTSLAILTDGSIVIGGSFSREATFGQGAPQETRLTSPGYTDGFLARYSSAGDLLWAKRATAAHRRGSVQTVVALDDKPSFVTTAATDDTALIGSYDAEGRAEWFRWVEGHGKRYKIGPPTMFHRRDGSVVVCGEPGIRYDRNGSPTQASCAAPRPPIPTVVVVYSSPFAGRLATRIRR